MLNLSLHGPHKFTPFDRSDLSLYQKPEAWKPGIYFWTFEYEGRYRVNYVGIAMQTIAQRQSDHLSLFLSGSYIFYDPFKLRNGELVRTFKPQDGANKFRGQFENLLEQLDYMQIFCGPIDVEKPLLERIESAFIKHFRSLPEENKWLDNERLSRNRKDDERPLNLQINAPECLHGFPIQLSV